MAGERRKYLRVLFEETIEVKTDEWTDPMATGLDISLNGTRFHCEHSMSEGDTVSIGLQPDFKLMGKVRWCWPIEWYYQAAVEFISITQEEQAGLREYISEVTGEPYPEYSDADLSDDEAELEEEESLDDIDALEEENLEIIEDSVEEALLEEEENELPDVPAGSLTPKSFEGKRVVILDEHEDHIELMTQYLSSRNGFDVGYVKKKINLWPLLKAQPADVILLSWELGGETTLEFLEQIKQRSAGTPVIFLSGPVSLEDRLQGLNAGAVDFITRPVHLSAIAQSIIQLFASASLPVGSSSDVEDDSLAVAAAVASVDDDEGDLTLSDDVDDDESLALDDDEDVLVSEAEDSLELDEEDALELDEEDALELDEAEEALELDDGADALAFDDEEDALELDEAEETLEFDDEEDTLELDEDLDEELDLSDDLDLLEEEF